MRICVTDIDVAWFSRYVHPLVHGLDVHADLGCDLRQRLALGGVLDHHLGE
jgi:hypothetical protein